MKTITVITGGQRSGKSAFAQKLALERCEHPVYLATSRIWDEEHRARIERHKADRSQQWINIEEETKLSRHDFTGKTVVVDCITLWSTNYFFDLHSDAEATLNALKSELDRLVSQHADFIFVTNEIGMGGTSENTLQRQFTDIQGWINQYITKKANVVYLMISGISVRIK